MRIDNYNLEKFDGDLATNPDDLIIAVPNREELITGGDVVTDFKGNNTNKNNSYPYVGTVNNKTVYFDENGVSQDKTICIKIAGAQINTTYIGKDNTITRSVTDPDTGETKEITFTFNSLNYREQLAFNVLTKFIEKENNPSTSSDARIKMLVDRAFDWAQEFMNQAANHRESDKVVIDPIYKVELVKIEKDEEDKDIIVEPTHKVKIVEDNNNNAE